jgi:hypothetical protein
LPSPACSTLAMELYQILKPVTDRITTLQQLQLARELTHSKIIKVCKLIMIRHCCDFLMQGHEKLGRGASHMS